MESVPSQPAKNGICALKVHKMMRELEQFPASMTNENLGGPRKSSLISYGLILAATALLYLNLFVFPAIPMYLDGDQTFFWEYALRLLHGERVYLDFFQFTPPGTDFYYLALFKLFGARLWVINLGILLLGVALCWLCFSIAQRLMSDRHALLAALFFLVLTYNALLDATHHWFSLLAVLCAVRVLMLATTLPRIALSGALLGLASFCTQTAGLAGLLAFMLFLIWQGFAAKQPWRGLLGHQSLLIAAFVLTMAALSAHLLVAVGWRQLWYFLVTYPRHYLIYQEEGILWQLGQHPSRSGLAIYLERRCVYALMLLLYPLALWQCWRRRLDPRSRQLALLALAGLFLLLEILPRANWTRTYAVSMPALILFIWAVANSRRWRRPLTVTLWIVIFLLAAERTVSRHRQNRFVAELPAGKAALSAQKYQEFSWLMQHTKPGDLFFQAGWLNIYPPLELRSPAFVDALTANDVTRPGTVALTIRQLEDQQVKYVLWTQSLNTPEDPDRPGEDHLAPFRAYLQSRYQRVQTFPGPGANPNSALDELWLRR